MRAADGIRESFVWLTAVRVRPPTPDPGGRGVLPWAPVVGVVLGAGAAAVAWAGSAVSPLVGAVLAVSVLALATRGLHLDGLADTADGLGPLRGRERALEVMRSGDVGPFGVATLVLTLLLQVACLAQLLTLDGGWLALWAAVVAARLAMSRCGLPGVRWRPGRPWPRRWPAPCPACGWPGAAWSPRCASCSQPRPSATSSSVPGWWVPASSGWPRASCCTAGRAPGWAG